MKKHLLLILLLPLYLFSSEVSLPNNYDLGFNYYNNQEFTKSYDVFHTIYLNNLENTKFNFVFGRSAYETGHYEMALAAFQRVQMQDASNLRNRLEMARTYFMLKMYEDSENAFRDVLENPNIPENIRTNIELSLSRVSRVQEKSFTYARVMMQLTYDSNVNYGSIADYQYGGGKLTKIDERADMALEGYASVTNIYDIGQKNGFAIKNSFSLYLKEYLEEADYNTAYLSYTPSILYKETKYTAEMLLGVDTLFMGRTQYLETLSFIPSIAYNHTPTLHSLAYFKYQVKNFLQESEDGLDANRYELSYGLQNILNPRSYVQGNIYFANETKAGGSNIYVNYNEYKASLSYANQFTPKYSVDFFGQMRLRNYDEYSLGFDSTRKDLGSLVNANFIMIILPTLRANFKTSYEYVDSNQDRFTYGKYTLSAGIIKTF